MSFSFGFPFHALVPRGWKKSSMLVNTVSAILSVWEEWKNNFEVEHLILFVFFRIIRGN